ncbi:MAG: TylF/MycF family methyltransferase [Candidatus Solibacter sp.]|nr:TylF/MycF family methyltransferase [Candidatus Solibacter sp.]
MLPSDDSPQRLYLELLKGCLTRLLFPDCCVNTQLAPTGQFDPEARRNGQDWPYEAETMIGMKRLDNVEHCVRDVLRRNVPGDLVEAGVWRGGASILMRGVLKAYGDTSRSVWVVDSFEGLPRANPDLCPEDAEDRLADFNNYLGVPLERVQANFERYNLLDEQVRFLKGWFRDTLPSAPIGRIAVLRLDGDMYESTMDSFTNLYDKVQVGGYIIVDDYGALANCRSAVHDFRNRRGILDPIQSIDWTGAFWQRTE